MNGAQSVFKALVDAGVATCFASPGTSQMQLVHEIGVSGAVRPILCLQEDSYAILGLEMARVRENELNARMTSMLDLGDPAPDWVKIATGHGVPATRATTAEDFHPQFEAAPAARGPHLILIECQVVTPKEWGALEDYVHRNR